MAPGYTEMAAKMRERPTFAVAEKVLQQDYKLKLQSRTFIRLWNTPEISQFRGYQNDLDESEKSRRTLQRERLDIGAAPERHGAGPAHERLGEHQPPASGRDARRAAVGGREAHGGRT